MLRPISLFADIEVILTKLKGMNVDSLVISGGEPFLRKDLPDIVSFADEGYKERFCNNEWNQHKERSFKGCLVLWIELLFRLMALLLVPNRISVDISGLLI